MSHVFISYVRENKDDVDRLASELTKLGAKVWLDRNDIDPGTDWKLAIKRAIEKGSYFIACFSKAQRQREKTEMNLEVDIAIEELKKYQHDRGFFISVLLDEGSEVPDKRVDSVRTLRDFYWVSLYEEGWDKGIKRIEKVVIAPEKKS